MRGTIAGSSKTSWRRCRPWSSETACSQRIGNWEWPSAASAGARRSTSRRFSATRARPSPGCARATRIGPRQPREVRHRAARCADHDQLRRHPPRLGRGHRVDRDAEPVARDGGGRGGAGGQAHAAREADRPRRRRARAHSRRGAAGRRPNDRLLRAEIQPVSEVCALAGCGAPGGSARSGSRARSICRASPTGIAGGRGSAPRRAAAVTCFLPVVTRSTRCAGVPASSR